MEDADDDGLLLVVVLLFGDDNNDKEDDGDIGAVDSVDVDIDDSTSLLLLLLVVSRPLLLLLGDSDFFLVSLLLPRRFEYPWCSISISSSLLLLSHNPSIVLSLPVVYGLHAPLLRFGSSAIISAMVSMSIKHVGRAPPAWSQAER